MKKVLISLFLFITFSLNTFAQHIPSTILEGHTDAVKSVVFSPDGRRLASGSWDNIIRLWDGVSGEPVATLEGHTGELGSIVFSPDGRRLVSWSSVGPIRLWDGVSGEPVATLENASYPVRFSPDGRRLASGNRLWDGVSGEPVATLEGHTGEVYSIVFSPDGSRLVLGSLGLARDNRGGTVRLWDGVSGEPVATLENDLSRYRVQFSPDGSRLVSGNRLWDSVSGEHLATLENAYDILFSPDGRRLAGRSVDNTIRLWDGVSGEHIATLEGHTDDVYSVVFSPDGRRLASRSGDRTVRLWDGVSGEPVATLENAYDILFSPDGRRLASRTYDDTIRLYDDPIRLWDGVSGELVATLEGHMDNVYSVVFSPDGRILASENVRRSTRSWHGADDLILLWNGVSGKHLATLEGHTEFVGSVVFSPDGRRLASGSSDRTIRLWHLSDTHTSLTPIPVVSPAIGEQFSISVSIVAGENVGGYQVSLAFDPTALRYVESANGDYLPPGAFFVPPVVSENKVTLGASSLAGESNGDGALATVTFEVVEVKESVIDLLDIILTDSAGEPLPQLLHSSTKVVEPTLLPSAAVISLTPSSVLSPAVGEQLTFNINIAGGRNVKDFALTLNFDQSALKHISSSPGNYLDNGVGNGDGTLETVTFEVLAVKASTVNLSGYFIRTNGLHYLPTFESAAVILPIFGDVNRDGVVNILDLVQVASSFGQPVPEEGNPADVNEDGVVNIVDLVKVAGALGGDAAAPSAWSLDLENTFTREQVQQWLSEAQQFNLTDANAQQGILYLEQLLAALTPKETALLPNYPNPFNPETWIPYQLSEAAEITLTIYAVDGTVVRTLALGHQSIGIYQGKSRAAYWDGRNSQGEPVASGVYFYTLTAGEFTATRKMLIRK